MSVRNRTPATGAYATGAGSGVAYGLTDAMRDRLWTIAQHKYGWGCYGYRDWPSFDALARRGLVERIDRGAVYHRNYRLTEAGMDECRRRFPVSPAVLRTYDHQPGGWTPREGVAA